MDSVTEEPNSDSKDVIKEKQEKIRKILPGVVKEGKIDVEKLKKLVGEKDLELKDDKYNFGWAGQKKAYKEIKNTTRKTLKPHRDRSVNFEDTENIFIEGENLDTLKTLQRAYSGEVKMIYIDPPYNTGSDFVYEDDFSQAKEEYEKKTGQRDEEGKLVANTESNGRFHSDWLNMMYPRLFMARNMLEQEGVIFVSIDDNEVHNLRMIMNEIFGEENFVAQFVWEGGRKNDSRFVSVQHDYVLCYAKDFSNIKANTENWRLRKEGIDQIYDKVEELEKKYDDYEKITEELKNWYSGLEKKNPAKDHRHYNTVDENGVYFPGDISWPGGGGPRYDVEHPETGKKVNVPSTGWRYSSKEKMEKKIEEGKVHFGEDETDIPKLKRYLHETEGQVVPSVFYKDRRAGSNEFRDLMGRGVFDNPKDPKIISKFIQATTESGDIIMDFFAGSGTTAQSVIDLNKDQDTDRKFICVQLPEETDEDSKAREEGYENIAQIAEERIRRVIDNENSGQTELGNQDLDLDLGFKVFSLEDTNFVKWSSPEDVEELKEQMRLQENPWKPDSDKESVIFEILLKEGFTPNAQISEVKDLSSTHRIEEDERELFICLEDEVDESVVDGLEIQSETKFVCKDSALSDTSKQNLSEKVSLKAI